MSESDSDVVEVIDLCSQDSEDEEASLDLQPNVGSPPTLSPPSKLAPEPTRIRTPGSHAANAPLSLPPLPKFPLYFDFYDDEPITAKSSKEPKDQIPELAKSRIDVIDLVEDNSWTCDLCKTSILCSANSKRKIEHHSVRCDSSCPACTFACIDNETPHTCTKYNSRTKRSVLDEKAYEEALKKDLNEQIKSLKRPLGSSCGNFSASKRKKTSQLPLLDEKELIRRQAVAAAKQQKLFAEARMRFEKRGGYQAATSGCQTQKVHQTQAFQVPPFFRDQTSCYPYSDAERIKAAKYLLDNEGKYWKCLCLEKPALRSDKKQLLALVVGFLLAVGLKLILISSRFKRMALLVHPDKNRAKSESTRAFQILKSSFVTAKDNLNKSPS